MSDAMATEITLLSAGAVSPGMVKVIELFRQETGNHVKITFATAPAIRKRISGGEIFDVVIAPPEVLDDLVQSGKAAAAERVTVCRIGVGVMVRDGVSLTKIATVDEFKRSLLDAESVVYNQASTGIYLESLFDRLGITEHLKAKTTRYPDATAVLNHIAKGTGSEIGFGAITVIIETEEMGLKFVGPLPAEIQNYTTYAATVVAAGANPEAARKFVRYITTPSARAALAAAGIE
jgi:molybdate transport system substrate-binding protein